MGRDKSDKSHEEVQDPVHGDGVEEGEVQLLLESDDAGCNSAPAGPQVEDHCPGGAAHLPGDQKDGDGSQAPVVPFVPDKLPEEGVQNRVREDGHVLGSKGDVSAEEAPQVPHIPDNCAGGGQYCGFAVSKNNRAQMLDAVDMRPDLRVVPTRVGTCWECGDVWGLQHTALGVGSAARGSRGVWQVAGWEGGLRQREPGRP